MPDAPTSVWRGFDTLDGSLNPATGSADIPRCPAVQSLPARSGLSSIPSRRIDAQGSVRGQPMGTQPANPRGSGRGEPIHGTELAVRCTHRDGGGAAHAVRRLCDRCDPGPSRTAGTASDGGTVARRSATGEPAHVGSP